MSKPNQSSQSNNIKVFVIEDNQVVGDFIRTSLSLAGIQDVVLFTDPSHAISAIRNAKVDLVITDLYMPRVNGFTLTQFLKRRPELCNIPVVVVSADQTEKTRQRLINCGVESILPKPIDSEQLVQAVTGTLHSRLDSARPALSPKIGTAKSAGRNQPATM